MENYLKLTLTDLGQKTMLRLIEIGKKPGLKVGVSHIKEKFLGNESDLSVKFQILPEAKITLQDDEKKLHIQALFASTSSYDIYQVGLFLEMSDEKDKLILLASYHSEELLAKKLAKQDMVLDIIVGLATFKAEDFTFEIKDVSPLFSMPPATHERHGSVRLATIKNVETPLKDSELVLSTTLLADQSVIAAKKPGFILTTNHLDNLFVRPDNPAQTFKPVSLYTGATAIKENIQAISFFSSYCDDKFIYLFVPIETVEGSKLILSRYDITAKAIKKVFEIETVSSLFQENNVLQAGSFCSYSKEQGVDYYFFTKKGSNLLRKLSVQIKNEELDAKLINGKTNAIPIGQSFLYDQKLFNIAVIKSSKEIIISFFKKNLERQGSLTLPYKGETVFAEVIQDKLYCIAMTSNETKLSPRVAIYKFMDNDSEPTFTYLPPPSTTLNFENFTANSILLSCQLDGAIYFFSLECLEKTTLKSDYYQYDVFNNHWSKWQFQGGPVTFDKSAQASLAKRGKEIYLCVTSLEQSKSVVSIIRLNG